MTLMRFTRSLAGVPVGPVGPVGSVGLLGGALHRLSAWATRTKA